MSMGWIQMRASGMGAKSFQVWGRRVEGFRESSRSSRHDNGKLGFEGQEGEPESGCEGCGT